MNAYTTISGGGFQPPPPGYDPNGNTLTLPRPDGSSQSLTWDIHNRLRSASSIHDPQSTISCIYDPLGRLVWTRTTTPGHTATDEVWSWSGWTLLTREVLQGSTPLDTFRYTWGPDLSNTLEGAGGVGGLLAIEHAAGSSTTWDIRHVHYDANGNVIALSTATGTISARYRYSPFGELIASDDLDSSGWNERNIHRFSTKPEVAGTGLLYYGYRWYDPVTGRWPSRDPIEEQGGINLYCLLNNSCLTGTDYLGLIIDRPGRDKIFPPPPPERKPPIIPQPRRGIVCHCTLEAKCTPRQPLDDEFVPCPKKDCPTVKAEGKGGPDINIKIALAQAKNNLWEEGDKKCGDKCSFSEIVEDRHCICGPN